MRAPVLLSLAALATACARTLSAPALPAGAEAISLLGDTLRPPALPQATRQAFEARLDTARRAAAARPGDPDALIWLGRRTAYLGRYRAAITIFTRGVERWPDDARFLRHRGHRWISVREFARAAADLGRAAELVRGRPDEVEPDGLPNARGIPTSTLQSNIFYHLGLAHWTAPRSASASAPGAQHRATWRLRSRGFAARWPRVSGRRSAISRPKKRWRAQTGVERPACF